MLLYRLVFSLSMASIHRVAEKFHEVYISRFSDFGEIAYVYLQILLFANLLLYIVPL